MVKSKQPGTPVNVYRPDEHQSRWGGIRWPRDASLS